MMQFCIRKHKKHNTRPINTNDRENSDCPNWATLLKTIVMKYAA